MQEYIMTAISCLLLSVGGLFGFLTIAGIIMIIVKSNGKTNEIILGMILCLGMAVSFLYAAATVWPT